MVLWKPGPTLCCDCRELYACWKYAIDLLSGRYVTNEEWILRNVIGRRHLGIMVHRVVWKILDSISFRI